VYYSKPEIKSLKCDVTIEVKGKILGIILLNKYSDWVKREFFEPTLYGVIAISIDEIACEDNGKVINHLRSYLKSLLESGTNAKHWIFHRREKVASNKALDQVMFLRTKEIEPIVTSNVINKTSPNLETVPWYCVSCQHEYQGYSLGLNPCPKCDSHFYRKML
jgi:hypothetical protein